MIRPVKLKDASALADLYNYYVINTTITFEEAKEIRQRFEIQHIVQEWQDGMFVLDMEEQLNQACHY